MLKEIARNEATVIKNMTPLPPFCFVHRKDGDIDFVNTFLKEMSDCVSNMNHPKDLKDLTANNLAHFIP